MGNSSFSSVPVWLSLLVRETDLAHKVRRAGILKCSLGVGLRGFLGIVYWESLSPGCSISGVRHNGPSSLNLFIQASWGLYASPDMTRSRADIANRETLLNPRMRIMPPKRGYTQPEYIFGTTLLTCRTRSVNTRAARDELGTTYTLNILPVFFP